MGRGHLCGRKFKLTISTADSILENLARIDITDRDYGDNLLGYL